jgi:hypothetical protein
MPQRWVQNNTGQVMHVQGRALLPGEGCFIDDGPLPQPAASGVLTDDELARLRAPVVSGEWRPIPPGWSLNVVMYGGASGGSYSISMRRGSDASTEVLHDSDIVAADEVGGALCVAEDGRDMVRVTLTGSVSAKVQ